MHIHCLGLSHHTTNVALRERLAFTPHQLDTALSRLGCGSDPTQELLSEIVILSTCNRVEIYAVAPNPSFDILENFLSQTRVVPLEDIHQSLYRKLDEDAVEHLLRVAAGLDSLILGEPQILGQVTDAYSSARRHGTVGKILSRLFQTAIYAGKRTRTQTTINQNPSNIASVAIKLISETVPDFANSQITVLGAGEMAELAVEALRKRGAHQITVLNRTLDRAQKLAERWNGEAKTLETLPDTLVGTDVLITSTSAPHLVLYSTMVEQVMQARPDRPLAIMDIAVPRDVEDAVAQIAGVRLYDMDALTEHLELSLSHRQAEVPRLEAILKEEKVEFLNYLASLDVVPIIIQMRRQANEIRRAELEKAIRRMPEITLEMQTYIDALTQSIVKKILHNPTIRLREEAKGPNATDYANVARGLFDLS